MTSERLSFSSRDKVVAATAAPVILFLAKTGFESVARTISSRREKQRQDELKREADLMLAEDSKNSGDFGDIFSNSVS